ncbi:hypothetical protein [Morganella psychrotolerans]|uniref:hypothetical protein n=1 Tax=Morganella psychrotolerans TaxID=368603 RepID=UPI000AE13AE2|nr:hypothetical protein [Morganella psychrotolerans]
MTNDTTGSRERTPHNIARECLAELEKPENKSDEQHTAILDKYTPKFATLNHLPHFPPKRVLGHVMRELQKERKDGGYS